MGEGNILLFDKAGIEERSRIFEFDPSDMSVVWKYEGNKDQPFFSALCGTAARLPNGNTLITETQKGRALEVAPDGEIMWECYNPHRTGRGKRKIAAIFGMSRLEPDFPVDWARLPPGK